jgi:type VI secretion system Hcp family effector
MVNAFMKFRTTRKASPSKGRGRQGLVEIQSWDWETKRSRADERRRRKCRQAEPGQAELRDYFDKSSPAIMRFICQGKSFDSAELNMCKTTGAPIPEQYFKMMMKNAYITKVSNSAPRRQRHAEGRCLQGDLPSAAEERRA